MKVFDVGFIPLPVAKVSLTAQLTSQGSPAPRLSAYITSPVVGVIAYIPTYRNSTVLRVVPPGPAILIGTNLDTGEASARSITLTGEDQSFYLDIDEGQRPSPGVGYLAGSFPDGITAVEGVPTPATVRVHYRAESGVPGDGILVAETTSADDGTWLITGLDPDLKFDVICRYPGYNDMILSGVSPKLAEGLEFSGSFTSLADEIQILLGTAPYRVDLVSGTAPLGVSFVVEGDAVRAVGEPENFGEFRFTLRVIDAAGLSGAFESEVVVEAFDPHWDNVVALLHFDDPEYPWRDETGRVWAYSGVSGVYELQADSAALGGYGLRVDTPAGNQDQRVLATAGMLELTDVFTLEVFIRPRATQTTIVISQAGGGGSSDQYLGLTNDLRLSYYKGQNASLGGGLVELIGSTALPLTEPSHIALVYDGNKLMGFARGLLQFSVDRPFGWVNTSLPMLLANGRVPGYFQYQPATNADLDEFRITKGIARYTENFTPPTEPFPNRGPLTPEAPPLPTIIGEPYGGGFYAGDIQYPDGQWYKLIVADVSADITGANSRWKTTTSPTAGTGSLTDGVANTSSMIVAGIALYPAANHCVSHAGGGNSDWYMPAKDELNVVYQNLGANRPACPASFLIGGPQAFEGTEYWSSTRDDVYNGGWVLHFSTGEESSFGITYAGCRVRPVRRIPFTPEADG